MDGLVPDVSSLLQNNHPRPILLLAQAHLPRTQSTSTISGYNDLFNFNTAIGAHDMPGSRNAEPTPTMDQSGNWNGAPSGSTELMEGGTAAQLHARLDFAPSQGAKSSG